jgi:DNA (cytosine-5)-methyltransferase 1
MVDVFNNNYVLSKIEENKKSKKLKIIHNLKKIVPLLNDTEILQLYDESISLHQSKNKRTGDFLENILVSVLEQNKVPYRGQVTIDKYGLISGFNEKKNKCYHIIDFVIGNDIKVGKPITDYKVISCKTTCRERWTQDNWSYAFPPKLYILLTISNDYPSSERFREDINRKIITCIPKKKDDRLFKLNFENLIGEVKENKKIKFIDLFCGIGSFHYSFKKLNWECVMSCDIDPAVRETYKENYNLLPLGDITEIEPKNIPNYDILCAGFPCQPFSQCGQHKGFDDKRGTLFFNIMKFIEYHKPKIIILENVQGLLKHDDGKTFDRIKNDIENVNYSISYKIIKCSDYGLPQMRKRLFIMAIRKDTEIVENIDKLLDFTKYEKESSMTQLLGKNFEKKIAYTIRCGGRNSPINDKHNWDGYIVDGKEYRLTKEDCLKIQGFDQNFKLHGNNKEQWNQLGNTIPTIFTEMIGLNINKYLS